MTATAPPADPAEETAEPGAGGWGRALDAAGIAAGVLLVVIVADIWTDGRLISRRLARARRPPQEGGAPGDLGQPQ